MQNDYTGRADELVTDENDELYTAIERDARRYNKAFGEEEEASRG